MNEMRGMLGGDSVMSVIAQLILCLLLAMGTAKVTSTPRTGSDPGCGEIVLGTPMTTTPELIQHVPVLLRKYAGQDVTALQLTVICEWPYRLEGVSRGPAVDDSLRWRIFSETRSGIARNQPHGADTMRIVLLSTTLSGLNAREESGLFWLAVRKQTGAQVSGTTQASMHITEVVGALCTGSKANISTAGSSIILDSSTLR